VPQSPCGAPPVLISNHIETKHVTDVRQVNGVKLVVSNFSHQVCANDLHSLVARCGRVLRVEIPGDCDLIDLRLVNSHLITFCTDHLEPRRCFVMMQFHKQAQRAIDDLNDIDFWGRIISVRWQLESIKSVCFDFADEGYCRNGDHCQLFHNTRILEAPPATTTVVSEQMRSENNTMMSRNLCFNFVSKGKCIRGSQCRYTHSENSIPNTDRDHNLSSCCVSSPSQRTPQLVIAPGASRMIESALGKRKPQTTGGGGGSWQ
jgi:hypothetical protein